MQKAIVIVLHRFGSFFYAHFNRKMNNEAATGNDSNATKTNRETSCPPQTNQTEHEGIQMQDRVNDVKKNNRSVH